MLDAAVVGVPGGTGGGGGLIVVHLALAVEGQGGGGGVEFPVHPGAALVLHVQGQGPAVPLGLVAVGPPGGGVFRGPEDAEAGGAVAKDGGSGLGGGRAGEGRGLQGGAVLEGGFAQARDGAGDGDLRQAALEEGPDADGLQALGEGNAFQGRVPGEGVGPQLRQRLGQLRRGQLGQVGEGVSCDAGDALAHNDLGDLIRVLVPGHAGVGGNVLHVALTEDGEGAVVVIPVDVLAAEVGAPGKRVGALLPGGRVGGEIIAGPHVAVSFINYRPVSQEERVIHGISPEGVTGNMANARRHHHVRDPYTVGECVYPDGFERIRQNNPCDALAVTERGIADGAKAHGQGQGRDGAPLVVPGCRGFDAVVVHIAGAGDGEDAGGVVQGPAQRVAAGPFIDRTHRVAGSDRGRGVRGGRVVGIRGSVGRSGLRFRRGAAVQGVPRRKDGKHHGQGQKQSEDSFRHGDTSVSEIRVCG